MKICVGLGNPGEKYENNRHNVGFMMVDYIIGQTQSSPLRQGFEGQAKFKSDVISIQLNGEKCLFVKPQTFMNNSGKAVSAVLSYYKFQPAGLIVIYDDLDIRLGDFKIQQGPGPKLHNGILSIERSIGTRDFLHVRIGVDSRTPNPPAGGRIDGETYVLQDFQEDEKKGLQEKVFPRIFERLIQQTNRHSGE